MSEPISGSGSAKGAPLTLSVAVTTYRRPRDLEELLPSLIDQLREVRDRFRVPVRGGIVVVDNDPERSAQEVVRAISAQHLERTGIGLRYEVEPEPGIAAARNRALASAEESRILVFIDDDERPEPEWLMRLLETWVSSRAAAVAGPVLPQYLTQPHPWVLAGDFYVTRRLQTGVDIGVAGGGNLLLDLADVRQQGIRFDEAVGLAGGEDNLFTTRLGRAGARMIWCAEARVMERVPPERTTLQWVLQRSWSDGNVEARTALRLAPRSGERLVQRLRGLWRGFLRVTAGLARAVLGAVLLSPRHQARGTRTLLRGAGMVAGALGLTHQHYARHGSRPRPRVRIGRVREKGTP
ncbi:glycosyltransferase involved in cell wall biosynthesis [Geodermatophilus bullaregiensis]|uniref:glycosyltransferase family 2 protein n=1 Tax=Geodermatophilus bullaregiensis TaxID=1564160 RepID=UPI001959C428|nr:glycosyltransferase [Geodermatophilus bullaregiensis]MBM7806996.1 glycosyltransferase involved in cell wall biosynthesis [Geodermatophilus bullaregiensis]